MDNNNLIHSTAGGASWLNAKPNAAIDHQSKSGRLLSGESVTPLTDSEASIQNTSKTSLQTAMEQFTIAKTWKKEKVTSAAQGWGILSPLVRKIANLYFSRVQQIVGTKDEANVRASYKDTKKSVVNEFGNFLQGSPFKNLLRLEQEKKQAQSYQRDVASFDGGLGLSERLQPHDNIKSIETKITAESKQILAHFKKSTEQEFHNFKKDFEKFSQNPLIQKSFGSQIAIIQQNMLEIDKFFEFERSAIRTDKSEASQGLHASASKSRVIFHDSTVPDNEYQIKQLGFMNMDRGAAGQVQGQNYGVVVDGSGSGEGVMRAAQAFTESIENSVRRGHFNDSEKSNIDSLREIAIAVFQTAVKEAKESEGVKGTDGGGATAVFATFAKKPDADQYQVNGAAIGDAVAISINRENGLGRQLNRITKDDPTDHKDPGGKIDTLDGIRERDIDKISVFSESVGKDDIVILASDGLADNIYTGNLTGLTPQQQTDEIQRQVGLVIPHIIFSAKFDLHPEQLRAEGQPWLNEIPPRLPSADDLQRFIEGAASDRNVDNETIARRLNNYVKFIAGWQHDFARNKINPLEIEMKNLEDLKRESGEITPEQQARYDALLLERDELMKEKQSPTNLAKTDDCMIVVLSPTGN